MVGEKPGSLFMVPPVIGTTAKGVPRDELPTPIGGSMATWMVKAGSRLGKSAICAVLISGKKRLILEASKGVDCKRDISREYQSKEGRDLKVCFHFSACPNLPRMNRTSYYLRLLPSVRTASSTFG